MPEEIPTWFDEVFTRPRIGRYLAAQREEGIPVDALYRWNLQISEAFYPSLHCLEVTLRNSLHRRLVLSHGRGDWWTSARLDPGEQDMVRKTVADLSRSTPPSPDDVVAKLSLGFWVSLLSRRYDRRLWSPALHRAFPHYRGRRDALHTDLNSIRLFRNRIMHHEPIHHRHLAADHTTILRILGFLEPEVVKWLSAIDRVPEVLMNRPLGTS